MVANAFYLTYMVSLLVLTKQHVIVDLSTPPMPLSYSVWITDNAIQFFFATVIIIGLIFILKSCNESRYSLYSLFSYLIMTFFFDIMNILIAKNSTILNDHPYELIKWLSYIILVNFLISTFFIKTAPVKKYYKLFAIISIIAIILQGITPILYDNFSFTWALINPNVLKITPFIVSFILYYKMFKNAPEGSIEILTNQN